MALHPQIQAVLDATPPPNPGPIDPELLRRLEEEAVPALADRLPVAGVDDRVLPTQLGDVPVRVYTPDDEQSHAVIVYLHGGAFFLGSLETHDHVCRRLAVETGALVVSVGYRRAPEHAFPAGLDDCVAALNWVAWYGEDELGWDGKTLAVAGDSSGGTFAAAVAAAASEGNDAVTHQVLLYPSLDLDFDESRYASLRSNASGYGLETAGLRPFNQFYFDSGADPSDPRVSPLKRTDLAGIAPALVVTAEFDPLRDEGELYGRRLREASVPAELLRVPGANHGFLVNFADLPEFDSVWRAIASFVRG